MQVKRVWRNGMRRSSVIYTLQHIGLLLYNEMKEYMIGGASSMIGKITKVTGRKVSK
jgi:hypothetical protein